MEAEKTAEMPEKSVNLDLKGLFLVDRGEADYYMGAAPTDSVRFPLTRAGFEAAVSRCANLYSPALPVDDSVRKVFVAFVHSKPRGTDSFTLEEAGKYLFQSIANALTWTISEEIKIKANMEAEELRRREKDERGKQYKAAAILRKQQRKEARKASGSAGPGSEKSA